MKKMHIRKYLIIFGLGIVFFSACTSDSFFPDEINEYWSRGPSLTENSENFYASQLADSSLWIFHFDHSKGYLFNPEQKSWIQKDLPEVEWPSDNRKETFIYALVDFNKLLAIRGMQSSNVWTVQAKILDLNSLEWKNTLAPNNMPKTLISLPNGEVLGLITSFNQDYNRIHIFKHSAIMSTWYDTGLGHLGNEPSYLLVDQSKILLSGGKVTDWNRRIYVGSTSQTLLDLTTFQVLQVPFLQKGRYGHALAKTGNQSFIAVGHNVTNYSYIESELSKSVEYFEEGSTTTLVKDSLNHELSPFAPSVSFSYNNKVYILGTLSGLVERYSIDSDEWTTVTATGMYLPQQIFPLKQSFLVLMQNGRTMEYFKPEED
jgi:hypothetical protein